MPTPNRQEYTALWRRLEAAAFTGKAELSPAIRRGAADPGQVPAEARTLIEKLHTDATAIDDADVRTLLAAGWTEDAVFELLVCGSVAAAAKRRDAGQAALDAALKAGDKEG